jgi:hypothetical protein
MVMPGKWSKFKDQFEKLPADATHQDKVDAVKLSLRIADPCGCKPLVRDSADQCFHGNPYEPLTKIMLCQELADADLLKKELEDKVDEQSILMEALGQILLAHMEDEEDTQIKNAYGTFYINDEPYASVEDKLTFIKWINDQGLQALLAVPWQSTNAQVKARLEAALEPPPGVKVYIKTTVRRRK